METTLTELLSSPGTIQWMGYIVIGVCVVGVVVGTTVEAALAWYRDSRLARWVVHRIEAAMWAMPSSRGHQPGRHAGPPIHRAARHGQLAARAARHSRAGLQGALA